MQEIRRLNAEDMGQASRLWTVVYNGRRDFSKDEPGKIDPLAHPPQWCWGVFDTGVSGTGVFENGKLLSLMTENEYLMRFDGHCVKMSGIGGVGTLPEARKGGLVRRIFEKLLPEAYERGVIFSNLTPFSHGFYRKFGYEIACARNDITIPTREFASLKSRGEFVPVFPGDDTAALQEIHGAYIADLNHGICRDYWPDNRGWKRFTQNDPYATGIFLYLWRDEGGRPRSYIKYQDVLKDDKHTMSVEELAFIDREGLYGALSIVSGLGAQFDKFRWLMPAFIDPADLSGNAWDIEQRIIPRDMSRIINVKAALEKMRRPAWYRPAGGGAYIIEVEDKMITANSGKFLVEYGGEEARVSSTTKDTDIHCDMPVLSQLVLGYRTLENALRTKQSGIEVYNNRKILDQVFTLRPQHVTEYF